MNRLRRPRSNDESNDALDRDIITPTASAQSPTVELSHDPYFRYVYKPLPNQSTIRLLELLPGEPEERIICRLHVVYIPEEVPYEAVSYAWGDRADFKHILCEGRIICIPRNLYTALVRFRYPDRSRWLWADAASIDQGGVKERGHQVTLMGGIFRRANNVLVWLGEDDGGDAVVVFPWISEFARKTFHEKVIDTASALNSVYPDTWVRLARILKRPWFRRLWTFQEVCLAKDAIAYCGEMQVSYADLELVLGALVRKGYSIAKRHQIPASFVRGRLGEYTRPSRSVYRRFFNTLCRGRTFFCSDSRDKVYGLLGLFQNDTFFEEEPLMRADYSKEPKDVYYEVALLLSRGTTTPLLFLSGVTHDKFPIDYPSWVPMWNLRRRTTELAGWKGTNFRASLDAQPDFRIYEDGQMRSLTAKGILLGEIDWHPDYIGFAGIDLSRETNGNTPNGLSPLIRLWMEFSGRVRTYPNGASLAEAFYQTITADSLQSRARDSFLSVQESLGDFIRYLEIACEGGAGIEDTIDVAKDVLQREIPVVDFSHYSAHQFLLCARPICLGRTFFTTRNGYCGLGPALLQPRDVVAVLYGSDVPIILRPCGDTYQCVGDCYVEGIMKGEAVSMSRMGYLDEEDIVLI